MECIRAEKIIPDFPALKLPLTHINLRVNEYICAGRRLLQIITYIYNLFSIAQYILLAYLLSLVPCISQEIKEG